MLKRFLVPALLLSSVCLPCAAQTVYESKDKAGNTVYSDKPSPGSKALDLPPPNVVQGGTPAPRPASKPAPAPAYTALSISSPANEDTLHSNSGEFIVNIRSVPALRAAAGDRILVKFDGTLLQHKYSSGAVTIRPEDWQAALDNAQHSLQVAIVNASGDTQIESAPVTFYVRRATVRRRAR